MLPRKKEPGWSLAGFAVIRLTPRPRPIDWTRLMLDDWARLQEALIAASFWAFSEEERGAKARIG